MYDQDSPRETILNFLLEMWAYQFPKVIGANLLFFLIYLCTKANTLVDFGWCFGHWIIGLTLILQYTDNTTYKSCNILIIRHFISCLNGLVL